jgi:hypothetical protein
MAKHQNMLVLQGEVVAKSPTGFTVMTKQSTFSGTYEHPLAVVSDKAVEIGERIKLKGALEFTGSITQIKATEFAAAGEGYLNVARLVGSTAGAIRFFPADSGKNAFANLLIESGGALYRTVMFEPLASLFARLCKRGSEVIVQGRLQNREYVTRDGDPGSMLEIVADPDYTRILSVPKADDPFLGFTAIEPAPAAPAAPAPAEQAPKAGKPGKSKPAF